MIREQVLMQEIDQFHDLIREHFPRLLNKISAAKPHAIVFLDSSARPFAWLTNRLWTTREHGPKPSISFLNPIPGWVGRMRRLDPEIGRIDLGVEIKLAQHGLLLQEIVKKRAGRASA